VEPANSARLHAILHQPEGVSPMFLAARYGIEGQSACLFRGSQGEVVLDRELLVGGKKKEEEEEKEKKEKKEEMMTMAMKLAKMRMEEVNEGIFRMMCEGVTLLESALLRKVTKEEILCCWKLKKLCVVSHGITFDFSEVRFLSRRQHCVLVAD